MGRNFNIHKMIFRHSKFYLIILVIPIFFSLQMLAQTDTVDVPSDITPEGGNLNEAVNTATESGTLSTTIFKLELNGYYVLSDSILVPPGEHLTIIAPEPGLTQETAPPQILCASGPDEYSSPVKVMFSCFGDITLKNIWLFYANTAGWQVSVNLQFNSSPGVISEQAGVFENIIFDYSGTPWNASGAVGITAKHFKGSFKNCYWKNCTDPHFRYYGRAVSFPYNSKDWHIDSLLFENCTFANIGYVYMQEGNEYADYIKFNHCTFFNVVMFPLESGWWNKLSVTNSVFENTFMYGDIPASQLYSPPYSFNEPNGGTIRIDSVSTFGFEVPFSDQDRHILFTNSSYNIEKWLRDWMFNNPASQWWRSQGETDYVPVPQPMLSPKTIKFFESNDFKYMKMANLFDSINTGFINAPGDTSAIKNFLYHKWYDSADSLWAWKPENSFNQLWPLEENLAYTNQELIKAGMGGFPLGDLFHWWPAEYSQWKLQKEDENARISYWLDTGNDSIFTEVKKEENAIRKIELLQNYPNPFNPNTNFVFRIAEFGLVSLKIYDILGREVATVIEKELSPGEYHIPFFIYHYPLSSGVYFYRLRANNFVQTKKFILLK